jgi:hypothetical protein
LGTTIVSTLGTTPSARVASHHHRQLHVAAHYYGKGAELAAQAVAAASTSASSVTKQEGLQLRQQQALSLFNLGALLLRMAGSSEGNGVQASSSSPPESSLSATSGRGSSAEEEAREEGSTVPPSSFEMSARAAEALMTSAQLGYSNAQSALIALCGSGRLARINVEADQQVLSWLTVLVSREALAAAAAKVARAGGAAAAPVRMADLGRGVQQKADLLARRGLAQLKEVRAAKRKTKKMKKTKQKQELKETREGFDPAVDNDTSMDATTLKASANKMIQAAAQAGHPSAVKHLARRRRK